ncbi:MAG: n-acetylglutamate synthase [Candidatus Solibacter sp.]
MDYQGRRFRPVVNSPHGQVSAGTLFQYRQAGDLLTGEYAGGGIRHGQLLGLVSAEGTLEFCYHHVTNEGEFRSGVCSSTPEILPDGRLRLHERWGWTFGGEEEGESVVEEVLE